MVAEKMRVHLLAKELNVPSKVIIEKCKAEGVDSVKNHMSTLSAGLHATIREWFSEGAHETTVETTQRVDLKQVRIKRKRTTRTAATKKKERATPEGAQREPEDTRVAGGGSTAAAPETTESPPAVTESAAAVAESAAAVAESAAAVAESAPAIIEPAAGAATAVAESPLVAEAEPTPVAGATVAEPQPVPPPTARTPGEEAPDEAGAAPPGPEAPAATTTPAAATVEEPPPAPERPPVKPAGPQNVPGKAKLQGPRVVRYESIDYDLRRTGRREREGRRDGPSVRTDEPQALGPVAPEAPTEVEKGAGRRKGRLSPRRGAGRTADIGERPGEWRDRDLQERRERLAGATGRRIHRRRATQGVAGRVHPAVTGPKTEATVHEPVRMKEFCAATGLNFMQCFKVLKTEHDIVANVNMALPTETAELLALHFGIELKIIPAKTLLDELEEECAHRQRTKLVPRSPVVTMLGHVDHGKTSLLDAIRATRVAAGEDGGITQHIGASRIDTGRGAVTFLDTPGHEAFTAMRARGAKLTDVVVLVVAADDGLMPQTIEAINHAKAASVPIVVALNKIDLGEQNKLKIYGQLAEQGLTPTGEWGGDVDVVPTSAITGAGVRELVELLADLSGLLELKADPTLPAIGTVIEAETKPGVGAVIRLLVQDGTLHVGDFMVCGPSFGKVRALLDDRGRRIHEAGPSLPVELWGLDDVPAAGDRLYVVDHLQRAKDIAAEMKRARIESARIQTPKVKTLEEMFERRDTEEIPELNLILKADVDGSVTALRQALSRPFTDEVKLTIRHAGVGTVTDSDILLASACGGLVVAFRVEPAGGVRRLAEQHGVDVRSYRVIYDLCDDIKKALEGLLAPEERVEHCASAEVRQLFRFGKKGGMVAGSHVSEGTLDRTHLAKIVRDGVVVREGCRFASLRRFKDDVKEVRAGLDCGIRFDGFDDIHVGDLIEAYKIVKIARTL